MRYSYSITEEAVLNEDFAGYRGGRVEVHDGQWADGYACYEWRFMIPENAFEKFSVFIEGLETEKPIMIRADFNFDKQEYEW